MESTNRERVALTGANNDQMDDYAIDIMVDLDYVPRQECCIYKIPQRLREVTEKAYIPQVISIGPLHHGKKSLAKMERQKSRYYQKFYERTSDETLEKFGRYIKENAERICRCYDELMFETEFRASGFMRMIQYDAVFIIEFFLRHFEVFPSQNLPPSSNEKIYKIYSATMLHEAGVRFKAVDKNSWLNVEFEKGELRIPNFYVGLITEAAIRNVMALEQCHYPKEAYFCSYIEFLYSLIDTDRDVDLLVKRGILDNGMWSSAAVADMINTLMVGVARARLPTCYAQIGKSLNKCYDSFWNRTVATLGNVYFSDVWRGTGTVAAFLVVLFTLTQTVLAILDRVVPTK
ncbi:hypothetical protein PTKIN_Ptkin12aG0206600 [Pterospermum kingtungense]